MANSIQTINYPKAQPISLKKEVSAGNNYKIVRAVSAVSTIGLTGGSIALGVLGGPIGAIIGLAIAAFLALASFIKAAQPKPKEAIPLTPTNKIILKYDASTSKGSHFEKAPKVKNSFTSAVDYAKKHPAKALMVGAVTLLMIGALALGLPASSTPKVRPVPVAPFVSKAARNVGDAIKNCGGCAQPAPVDAAQFLSEVLEKAGSVAKNNGGCAQPADPAEYLSEFLKKAAPNNGGCAQQAPADTTHYLSEFFKKAGDAIKNIGVTIAETSAYKTVTNSTMNAASSLYKKIPTFSIPS